MAGTFKNRKLFLAFNSEFKRQTSFGIARLLSEIDARQPQETPTFPSLVITREQTRDCGGEYIISEDITSRLRRLQFSFFPDAKNLAGWLALAYGSAAISAATKQNTKFDIISTATGGQFYITFDYDGIISSSELIQYNATAGQLKTALEKMRGIKAGNVQVTGTDLLGGLVIEFIGRLAGANIPVSTFTINDIGLTGGTVTPSLNQAGANNVHTITRNDIDNQPPLSTFVIGFDGDTYPLLIKNAVVNSVTITGQLRGRVQCEVDIVASAENITATGFTAPACINTKPIKTADCRVEVEDVFPFIDLLREFRFSYSNNILTGDDPFPFDDIDAIRLERGDRTSELSLVVYGSRGDTLYNIAESELQKEVKLHIGEPGQRVSVIAPETKLKLQDTPIAFAGEANRSVIQLTGLPLFAGAGTPDSVSARLDFATAFLGL